MDSQSQRNTQTIPQSYAKLILEHMPVGVALFDAHNLSLLTANGIFQDFFDMYLDPCWHHGGTLGHSIIEWLPGEDATDVVFHLRNVAETGKPYRAGEYAFSFPDHGLTYWNWTIDPIHNEDDHIIQLVLTASNITTQVLTRQQAERTGASLNQTNRIVEAERKRLAVIETVARSVREPLDKVNIGNAAIKAISASFDPLCVCIYTAETEQRILRLLCVQFASDMQLTRPVERVVSYDSIWLMGQAYKYQEPIIAENLQTAATAGIIDRNHPLVVDGVCGYICVPFWFGDHFEGTLVATFRDAIVPNGTEVRALVGCGMYIAAAFTHARLHTALENERTRLRTVVDQLPEGILIVEGIEGSVSYANAAASYILGVPITNLLGTPFNAYSHTYTPAYMDGKLVQPWNFVVIDALCGEIVNCQETMVTRSNGSRVVALCSSTPLRREDGAITGAVIVFQDITARKTVEQHKNEFLSIVSHELRTPITSIQGLAEILQMQVAEGQSLDSPRSLRAISNITAQSQHLNRLIHELIDLSRTEHTQLQLNRAPHDLLALLIQAIESQAITTKKHDLHFVLEGLQPTDTLIGSFDADRIMQVITNLISNAIKYSPAGGEIEVGLRSTPETSDKVLIWIKDRGIGIPTNELPHIFERFHRASNLDRSISGFGIGLYLVEDVVTRHGGRVRVESVEGVGSTFYVSLPLITEE